MTTDLTIAAEAAIVHGDLSKLSPAERVTYVVRVCESLGLNHLTKPFEYVRLNGKDVLYATRNASDQLRHRDSVSVRIVAREMLDGVYVVTAQARLPNGREDESTGVVATKGLTGESLANALMKAETKAKRRVTLSICGLGMPDETEIESAGEGIKPGFTEEQQVRATEQAKRRLLAADVKDELAPMFDAIEGREALEELLRGRGYEMHHMSPDVKTKLWKHVQAACVRTGLNHMDAKKIITNAPEYPDADLADEAAKVDRGDM